jgi:hypothetical protein
MPHVLYTSEDFTSGKIISRNNTLADFVIEGGLSICKKCGEYEAGLDAPCRADRPIKSFDLLKLADGRYFEYRYESAPGFVLGVRHERTASGNCVVIGDAYLPLSELDNAEFIDNLKADYLK